MLQLCAEHQKLHVGVCPECADTMPPGAAEEALAEFEAQIAASSEAAARWQQLLQLLEGAK